MKITNKKIIAALLIAATLTGCDDLNNEPKDAKESQVEESTDQAAGENETASDEEVSESEEEKDSKDTDTEVDKDSEETDTEEDATSEAETESGSTAVEKLEDAIFNNRVQARAAEILLEETPESLTEEHKATLEELLEKSNDIIERSEKALEAFNK